MKGMGNPGELSPWKLTASGVLRRLHPSSPRLPETNSVLCASLQDINKVISQQNVSDHRIQLRLSCVHGDGCIARSFLKLVSADCQDSKPTTQDRSNKIGRSIPRRVI